jgi:3-methyladenine DNA glycosylase AlkD
VSPADRQLIEAVRSELSRRAKPDKADPMRAYMKSELPFYGVQKPARQAAFEEVFAAHPLAGFEEWRATVFALWDEARFREERYGAIALTGDRHYAAYQTPEALPLYERLIVTGAWWDFVDELATRRVGPILRSHAHEVRPIVLAWSRHDDLWLRRTSIICQIGSKGRTDRELLTPASSRAWASGTSFSARQSGGPSASTRRRIPAPWPDTSMREPRT